MGKSMSKSRRGLLRSSTGVSPVESDKLQGQDGPATHGQDAHATARRLLSHTLGALAILLALGLTVFVGCKKKEQPKQVEQNAEAQGADTVTAVEKIDLRILYAGLPDTDRAKDFMSFLESHFRHVEMTDYSTFTGSHSSEFDVAIVDHNGLGFRTPIPNIPRQYSRATVTVGVPGAFLCRRLSLKTGYL
jgi:hypothetical protein